MVRQKIRTCEKLCKQCGFTKIGANYYRICGDGLLQVLSLNGFPERVSSNSFRREPSVCFEVFSLYGFIPWNTKPLWPQCGLIPTVFPGAIDPRKDPCSFEGTAFEVSSILLHILPFLNKTLSHLDLVKMYEMIDSCSKTRYQFAKSSRIVPYILTHQNQQALDIILRIEKQKWDAFEVNRASSETYDAEKHFTRITNSLAPLLKLRTAIYTQDVKGLWEILQFNYNINMKHLSDLGLVIPQSVNQLTIDCLR